MGKFKFLPHFIIVLILSSCGGDSELITPSDFAGIWNNPSENLSLEVSFTGSRGAAEIIHGEATQEFSASLQDGVLKLSTTKGEELIAELLQNDKISFRDGTTAILNITGLTADRTKKFVVFNPAAYDFYTTAVDKSWYLGFNFNGNLNFSNTDGIQFSSIVSSLPTFNQSDDRVSASASVGTGSVEVSIIGTTSGDYNDYTTNISVNIPDQGFTDIYSSVGHFNGGYRLTGRWQLTKLNGREITAAEFGRSIPSLSFNRGTRELTGFGGCNNLTSDYTFDSRQVYFRDIISTRRTCQHIESEIQLIDGIGNRNFRISYYEDSVILTTREFEVVFTKSN